MIARVGPSPTTDSSADLIELRCPQCGYDLRAITSEKCPECGTAVDRESLARSQIPWVYRKELGRWKAFWKTVRLATFHPVQLAEEMNRPTHLCDAILFRRAVVFSLFAVLFPLNLIWLFGISSRAIWHSDDWILSLVNTGYLIVPNGIVLLWLFLLTGVPSLFARPRTMSVLRQNRSVALSFYACAGLMPLMIGWLIACVLFLLVMILDHSRISPPLLIVISCVASVVSLLSLAPAIVSPIVLMRRATLAQGAARVRIVALMPVMWMVVSALALVVIPLAWWLLGVMVLSLRP
jgi:hypothetical protein